MSAFRILALILIALGGVFMLFAIREYLRFLRYLRESSYEGLGQSRALQNVSLVVLIFFFCGYVVGLLDVLLRDVEPVFLFIGVVFFFAGLFALGMMYLQVDLTRTLQRKSLEIMRAFVSAIEMKDDYTRGHSLHVYHLVRVFYQFLPDSHKRCLNEPKLLDAALLHDIGKIGVPDEVLTKEDPLNSDEWDLIKLHPSIGSHMLQQTSFAEIADWVFYHHERVDGNGYYGLSAEQIPLEARIIAIADTYSAMSTDRAYRQKREHDHCLTVLREAAGAQLDEELVRVFCTIPREYIFEATTIALTSRPSDVLETYYVNQGSFV